MATPKYSWPGWMPLPDKTVYSVQPADRRTKTDMEIDGIVRVQFDTDETVCQCTLTLSENESAWFEAFEANLLKQGSIWFQLPLWIGGQIVPHIVRFKERPKVSSLLGLYTKYVLVLEVAQRELWSADVVESLLMHSPDDLIDWSNSLHYIMHVQAPGVTILPVL